MIHLTHWEMIDHFTAKTIKQLKWKFERKNREVYYNFEQGKYRVRNKKGIR